MGACYTDWENSAPELGNYLSCLIERAWTFAQIILIATTLILLMYLAVKIIASRENQEEMKLLPKRILFIFILIFVAIGAVGWLINQLLTLFGFGDVQYWLDQINTFLNTI